MFVPHSKHTQRPVTGITFTYLYVDDVRTSQEARHVTVIAFTCLYVDDVRTSQEARPVTERAFTCLHADDVRTSQETRPVTGTTCLIFILQSKTKQSELVTASLNSS
jgi:hypothetical protein